MLMKKLWMIPVVLLVMALVLGCGGGGGGINVQSTDGRLTIESIPSTFEGKWIIAMAASKDLVLIAAAGISGDEENPTIHGEKISSGKATLKVWRRVYKDEAMVNYNGSGTENFLLMVYDEASVKSLDIADKMIGGSSNSIPFANGKGTADGSSIIKL
jgi:hypothetical protein